MKGGPSAAPAGDRQKSSRAPIILLLPFILFAGGVFQAQRALHIERAPLPFTALHRIAATQPNTTDAPTPPALCSPTLPLSIVTFSTAGSSSAAHSSGSLCSDVLAAAPRLLPLQAHVTAAYYDPTLLPHLKPCSYPENCPAEAVSPQQAVELGRHLLSLLPASLDDGWTALVFSSPPNYPQLRFEAAGKQNKECGVAAFQVSERELLVVVEGGILEKTAGIVAGEEIVAWLMEGVLAPAASERASEWAQRAEIFVSRACVQQAAANVGRFLRELEVSPDTGVTSAVAASAEAAVAAYEAAVKAGDESGGLERSRAAWEAAKALVVHPDMGVRPQLPMEHVLALLLPIGLPVSLALAQALVREARGALDRRKAARGKTE